MDRAKETGSQGHSHSQRYKYRSTIFLVLFLEKSPIQLRELFTRLDYILGEKGYRKATVFEWIKRLEERTTICTHKVFSKGKYETRFGLNPDLSVNFVSKLKHGVAEFFGFKTWNNGLVSEGRNLRATYLNARNIYSHAERSREGLSQPKYQTDKNKEQFSDGYEALPKHRREAETLMSPVVVSTPRPNPRRFEGVVQEDSETPAIPQKNNLRDLDRRTAALLERYGSVSQKTMKGDQKCQKPHCRQPVDRGTNIHEEPHNP